MHSSNKVIFHVQCALIARSWTAQWSNHWYKHALHDMMYQNEIFQTFGFANISPQSWTMQQYQWRRWTPEENQQHHHSDIVNKITHKHIMINIYCAVSVSDQQIWGFIIPSQVHQPFQCKICQPEYWLIKQNQGRTAVSSSTLTWRRYLHQYININFTLYIVIMKHIKKTPKTYQCVITHLGYTANTWRLQPSHNTFSHQHTPFGRIYMQYTKIQHLH